MVVDKMDAEVLSAVSSSPGLFPCPWICSWRKSEGEPLRRKKKKKKKKNSIESGRRRWNCADISFVCGSRRELILKTQLAIWQQRTEKTDRLDLMGISSINA